jgi:hypothetical protein
MAEIRMLGEIIRSDFNEDRFAVQYLGLHNMFNFWSHLNYFIMDQSGCKSELPFLTFNTLEFFLTQTAFV